MSLGAGTWTNLFPNPRPATGTGWSHVTGSGATVTASIITDAAGPAGNNARRLTWTVGSSNVNGGQWFGSSGGVIPVTAGSTYAAAVWVRLNRAQTIRPSITFVDAAGITINSVTGVATALAANTWTVLRVDNAVAGAGATQARVICYAVTGTGATAWQAGDTYDAQAGTLIAGASADPFHGGLTNTSTANYAWTGTADASTSTAIVTSAATRVVDRLVGGVLVRQRRDRLIQGTLVQQRISERELVGSPGITTEAFIDSIGVCVHLAYSGVYTEWTTGANTRAKILDLGIRHLRDFAYVGGTNGQQNSTFYTRLRDLVANGVKFNLSTQAYLDASGKPVTDWSQLEALYTTWANGGVVSFEGHNEPENTNAVATRQGLVNLWNTVQASDVLRENVKVLGFPLIYSLNQWDAFIGGVLSDNRSTWTFDPAKYCDFGNWHPYPGAVKPTLIGGTTDHLTASAKDAKMFGVNDWNGVDYGANGFIITECDYNTALAHGPTSHYPISPLGQGKYVLRQFAEYFRMGYRRTYAYELMDQGADNNTNPEMNFGWVYRDGSVKPAYTAVKNMISLLADPGVAFTPTARKYTVTGGDADVRHLLFGKRDGSSWLLIWQDKSVWNRDTQTDLSPADQTVAVNFAQAVSTATRYTPRTGITGTAVTLTNGGTTMSLSVPAEVMLVKVT